MGSKDIFADDDDDVPPNRRGNAKPNKAPRLTRLPNRFVRVPVQWLTNPGRLPLFEPRQKLFLYLLYRSRWGTQGVKLTAAAVAELGLASRTRRQVIADLERDGWVRVERDGPNTAPTVWPIVSAG